MLKIKLDLDGVYVDFVKAALRLMKVNNVSSNDTRIGWDFYKAFGFTDESFWKLIHDAGPEFWRNLELFEWSEDLLALCKQYGDVEFVTSPSQSAASSCGKLQFFEERFGSKFRGYCLKPQNKHDLAKDRTCVLIDDYNNNIDGWQEAGGFGILFPQPWNYNKHRMGKELEYVRQMLEVAKKEAAVTAVVPKIEVKTIGDVQHLPGILKGRVETGNVAFGDDWPGLFIRGDNCAFYQMHIKAILDSLPKDADLMAVMGLKDLQAMLCGTNVNKA